MAFKKKKKKLCCQFYSPKVLCLHEVEGRSVTEVIGTLKKTIGKYAVQKICLHLAPTASLKKKILPDL